MFKGTEALRSDVDDLVRSVRSFQKSTLSILTDPRTPHKNAELIQLKKDFTSFVNQAKAFIADPAFATALTDDDRHNVTVIAEEYEVALAELEEITHPDKHWNRLSGGERVDLIGNARVEDAHTARIRDRATGQLRGLTVPPVNPPTT